jgi:hypothetical protein
MLDKRLNKHGYIPLHVTLQNMVGALVQIHTCQTIAKRRVLGWWSHWGDQVESKKGNPQKKRRKHPIRGAYRKGRVHNGKGMHEGDAGQGREDQDKEVVLVGQRHFAGAWD